MEAKSSGSDPVSGRRQLRAIGPLPGLVAVVVPTALAVIFGVDVDGDLPAPLWIPKALAGAALIFYGFRLWLETVRLFAAIGRGTLAPWDPTRRLVVRGPYLRVRNPMISAVAFVLLGEAIVLGSPAILVWFGAFALLNAIFIPLAEEPGLVRRFGEDYEEYRRNVPRWIPRSAPWAPPGES